MNSKNLLWIQPFHTHHVKWSMVFSGRRTALSSPFLLAHSTHDLQNLSTSPHIPFHQYLFFIVEYIFFRAEPSPSSINRLFRYHTGGGGQGRGWAGEGMGRGCHDDEMMKAMLSSTHTHIHTYTHTHIHTYTHTYIMCRLCHSILFVDIESKMTS